MTTEQTPEQTPEQDAIEIPLDERGGPPAGVEMTVLRVQRGRMRCAVLGTTPFICNRMAEKARRDLLYPKGRPNAAEKASRLKHEPLEEYRNSPYIISDPQAPTLIGMKSTAFKKGISTAALDLPGSTKSQVGRLTYVEGELVGLYGAPKIYMTPVRQAGMQRTPDIRTRAILPRWAAYLSVTYVRPMMGDQAVLNLLAAAGITVGVGDYRQEKGAGSYGLFEIVSPDDPRFLDLVENEGRAVQMAGLDKPEPYDDETRELLTWFLAEVEVRKKDVTVVSAPRGKKKEKGA